MIIYNVTIKIEHTVAEEWLQWMKEEHIPHVMSTGLFIASQIYKVLVDDVDGATYSIQYQCRNMNDYEKYKEEFAPAMQAEMLKKYANRFVAFRTLLEKVG